MASSERCSAIAGQRSRCAATLLGFNKVPQPGVGHSASKLCESPDANLPTRCTKAGAGAARGTGFRAKLHSAVCMSVQSGGSNRARGRRASKPRLYAVPTSFSRDCFSAARLGKIISKFQGKGCTLFWLSPSTTFHEDTLAVHRQPPRSRAAAVKTSRAIAPVPVFATAKSSPRYKTLKKVLFDREGTCGCAWDFLSSTEELFAPITRTGEKRPHRLTHPVTHGVHRFCPVSCT